MEMKFNEAKWNEKLKMIGRKFGDIPIFAFMIGPHLQIRRWEGSASH